MRSSSQSDVVSGLALAPPGDAGLGGVGREG